MRLQSGPAVVLGALVAVTVTLAGCSGTGRSSSNDLQAETHATSGAATPQAMLRPTATPTVTAIPDPCQLLTAQQVAAAAGVPDLGEPIEVAGDGTFVSYRDGFGNYSNVRYCQWQLSGRARAALNVDTLGADKSGDILIEISTYNGDLFSSSGNEWSDSSAQDLPSSYFNANQEVIGTNPAAQWVPESQQTMVQDGSEVVTAVNDVYWTKVILFSCGALAACRAGAVGVAKAVRAAMPSGRG